VSAIGGHRFVELTELAPRDEQAQPVLHVHGEVKPFVKVSALLEDPPSHEKTLLRERGLPVDDNPLDGRWKRPVDPLRA
jgi:hypothetical protein